MHNARKLDHENGISSEKMVFHPRGCGFSTKRFGTRKDSSVKDLYSESDY